MPFSVIYHLAKKTVFFLCLFLLFSCKKNNRNSGKTQSETYVEGCTKHMFSPVSVSKKRAFR
jgi:hypothetical protein